MRQPSVCSYSVPILTMGLWNQYFMPSSELLARLCYILPTSWVYTALCWTLRGGIGLLEPWNRILGKRLWLSVSGACFFVCSDGRQPKKYVPRWLSLYDHLCNYRSSRTGDTRIKKLVGCQSSLPDPKAPQVKSERWGFPVFETIELAWFDLR